MQQIDDIAAEVRRGARIGDAEAARLWREAPLWLLGELATECKRRVSGDKVYFNRNFHIEPTNRCVFNCRFCSYRRPAGSPEAWDYTMEEIEQIAREKLGMEKVADGQTSYISLTQDDEGTVVQAEKTPNLLDRIWQVLQSLFS